MSTSAEELPVAAPPAVAIPATLSAPLSGFARRVLVLAWLGGAARLLLLFLAAALVRGQLDYWLQLSWPVRAIFLAADLGIAAWIARAHLWLPWKHRLDDARAALRLQKAFPVLGSHLIAAVQLPRQVAEGRASASLVERAVHEAGERLAVVAWRDAAPARPVVRWWLPVLGASVLAGVALALRPDAAPLVLRRVWLSTEAPFSRTRLEVSPGDTLVALGSPFAVTARAAGEIPAEAVVEIRSDSGEPRSITLASAPETPGLFTLAIDNVQLRFRYRVLAGDARSPWHDVTVSPPPVMSAVSIVIEPPAYTGLPSVTADGDTLQVPAGSTLRLSGRAASDLAAASIDLWDNPSDSEPAATLPLTASGSDFSGVIPPDQLAGAFSIRLAGRDGFSSQNDTRFRLDLQADRPPVIELASAPDEGALATATQSLRLRGRVADDYGVAGLVLRWKIEREGADPAEGESPVELSASLPRQSAFSAELPLAERVAPGATLSWWLEARDQNPYGAPSVLESRALRIVTPEEKVADTLDKVRDRSAVLDDIGRAQDSISESLGQSLESAPQP